MATSQGYSFTILELKRKMALDHQREHEGRWILSSLVRINRVGRKMTSDEWQRRGSREMTESRTHTVICVSFLKLLAHKLQTKIYKLAQRESLTNCKPIFLKCGQSHARQGLSSCQIDQTDLRGAGVNGTSPPRW